MAIKWLSFGLWAVTMLPMVLGEIGQCYESEMVCDDNCDGFFTICRLYLNSNLNGGTTGVKHSTHCCKRLPGYGLMIAGIVIPVVIVVGTVVISAIVFACFFCESCPFYRGRGREPVIEPVPMVYQATPVVDGQMPPPEPTPMSRGSHRTPNKM